MTEGATQHKLSVFIRTYKNDAKWLGYCLKGLRRVKYDELVIICPEEDKAIIWNVIKDYSCKFFQTKEICEGYIAQQLDKMKAHKYCTGDVILFVDSDVVFIEDVDVNYFIQDEKIFLLRTKYTDMPADHAVQNWQWITEKMIGFKSEWEYMRRLPLAYWRETLVAINNAFEDIDERALQKHDFFKPAQRAFTEFNFIGQFIEKYHYHYYKLIDTNDWLPDPVVKQFWSYSGLTTEEEKEIQMLLA